GDRHQIDPGGNHPCAGVPETGCMALRDRGPLHSDPAGPLYQELLRGVIPRSSESAAPTRAYVEVVCYSSSGSRGAGSLGSMRTWTRWPIFRSSRVCGSALMSRMHSRVRTSLI